MYISQKWSRECQELGSSPTHDDSIRCSSCDGWDLSKALIPVRMLDAGERGGSARRSQGVCLEPTYNLLHISKC